MNQATQLNELIEQLPEIRAFKRKEQAKVDKERADKKKALEAETGSFLKRLEQLKKKEMEALQALEQAKAKAEALGQAHIGIIRQRMSESHTHDRMKTKVESFLRDTADPAIDEFIRKWRDIWEVERHMTQVTSQPGYTNPLTGKKKVGAIISNYEVLQNRLNGIRQAQKEAEALKYEVGIDVAKELQAIESRIPQFNRP